MKILFAYDGSECADAALVDLWRSGLPANSEALVLTAVDVFMPPDRQSAVEAESIPVYKPYAVKVSHQIVNQTYDDAGTLAKRAGEKLRVIFSDWNVTTETIAETPHWGIITKADEWKPDLIVVGSHGRSAFGRAILGSVSQKVLYGSNCSVRIARGRKKPADKPIRLILGVDGSPDSDQMINVVASRNWKQATQVKVITAVEPFPQYEIEPNVQMNKIRDLQNFAVRKLRAAGLDVTPIITDEDPKHFLINEANSWDADCIFLGAKGHRFIERFLLGSVSSAIAARAVCSVEVVRKNIV